MPKGSARGVSRWFLTVDWCNKGERGIFCDTDGNPFSKETQHTQEEMIEVLGPFFIILDPQSVELTPDDIKGYCQFRPLEEYSGQYGYAVKQSATEAKYG